MIQKITATNAEIAKILESASIPTLMMSMIHMSGDSGLLDGTIRPNAAMLNEAQGFMSEEDKATIRKQALEIIAAYRDSGSNTPHVPNDATLKRMLNFIVGEEKINDDYVAMMSEEMVLSGTDQRLVDISAQAIKAKTEQEHFHVVVIGGGMSGVLAGVRLKQAGIDFTILEKNAGVGGTWYENRYPGCRVDIASHFYSFSFEPFYPWKQYYAVQSELANYFQMVVEKYDLAAHIKFNAEVTEAQYNETDHCWDVSYSHKDSDHTINGNAIITAVGQLNRPKIPNVKGLKSFKGKQMHTATWDTSISLESLKDKRIAVVGTGASAFQLVPELSKTAKSLTVLQRSPPWMMPNEHYHKGLEKGKQWCIDHLPMYQKWYRFLIFWPGSDAAYPILHIDPEWDDNGESINEMNKFFRDFLVDYVKSQVEDPDLIAKVIPDYPPMGKRLLQDNGTWLKALQKDNVHLIDRGVNEVTPDGLIDANGDEHKVDMIVWATGFHADEILAPMRIVGKSAKVLSEVWGEDPEAYLGISVPEFPNMFSMYGVNTNLAHAGSLIFHSECQIRYIMQALKSMVEDNVHTIECRSQVCDEYNDRLQKCVSNMVWAYPKMNNWYKNANGKITTTSPWLLVDYWKWTRQFNPKDYQLSS